MRFDTSEDKRQKIAKMIAGGDTRQGLDLVRRSDYASEDEYLDAAAKAELERENPEYKAVRARLQRELEERQGKEYREQQSEMYKQARASVKLSSFDIQQIDEEASALGRRDLVAGRVSASGLAGAIEQYAAKLTEKRKNELASNMVMNAMLRGDVGSNVIKTDHSLKPSGFNGQISDTIRKVWRG